MSGSINKVILVGNLGSDPEVRRMSSGDPVVNLSVATSESWRDKNSGEKKERTEWHRVVIFNDHLAKVAENYLHKGAKVYVEGSLQTRKWQDQNGNDKYSTEIVLQKFRGDLQMLDAPKMDDRQPTYDMEAGAQNANEPEPVEETVRKEVDMIMGGGDLDDEIPFGPEWR